LPHARAYSRTVIGLPGAYYPMSLPLVSWNTCHREGVPNKHYYEHNNQAYVAAMVVHFADITGDTGFLRDRAWPVLCDLADFFVALLSVNPATGKYGQFFQPSSGQDEFTAGNMPDFLDILVSADFTLRLAVDTADRLAGIDPAFGANATLDARRAAWQHILDVGLDYDALEYDGVLGAFLGDQPGTRRQKHPPQLNPVSYLPVPSMAHDARTRKFWQNRYQFASG
jgi:trehalose/maltose hydrolase-like predicted phosphorylase